MDEAQSRRWCEHCRDHFDANHYDVESGRHGVGAEYGPYGELLATAGELQTAHKTIAAMAGAVEAYKNGAAAVTGPAPGPSENGSVDETQDKAPPPCKPFRHRWGFVFEGQWFPWLKTAKWRWRVCSRCGARVPRRWWHSM